jgi:hypothetical protein
MTQPNVPVSKTGHIPPAKLVRGGLHCTKQSVAPPACGNVFYDDRKVDRYTWSNGTRQGATDILVETSGHPDGICPVYSLAHFTVL